MMILNKVLTLTMLMMISLVSCSRKAVPITVFGGNDMLISMYNGHNLILSDSLYESPTTAMSLDTACHIRFKDSIRVVIQMERFGVVVDSTVKLKNGKFVTVKSFVPEFEIFSSKDRYYMGK